MKTIKFEYGFKSVNGIEKKVYSLSQIPNIEKICDVWNTLPIVYVRQYTGLKDCNGVEVFEGDTLIDVDVTLEENIKLEDTKQQVYWCGKDGCWKLDNTFSQNKKEGFYLGKDLKDFRFKVSGNVYENALS